MIFFLRLAILHHHSYQFFHKQKVLYARFMQVLQTQNGSYLSKVYFLHKHQHVLCWNIHWCYLCFSLLVCLVLSLMEVLLFPLFFQIKVFFLFLDETFFECPGYFNLIDPWASNTFHFLYCSMVSFPKFRFNYFVTLIAVLIYKSSPFYSYCAMA